MFFKSTISSQNEMKQSIICMHLSLCWVGGLEAHELLVFDLRSVLIEVSISIGHTHLTQSIVLRKDGPLKCISCNLSLTLSILSCRFCTKTFYSEHFMRTF